MTNQLVHINKVLFFVEGMWFFLKWLATSEQSIFMLLQLGLNEYLETSL